MWYVYFLELRNDDIYVGSTDDLRRRMASHERGQVTSTKKFLPLTLKLHCRADRRERTPAREIFQIRFRKGLCEKAFLVTLFQRRVRCKPPAPPSCFALRASQDLP